MKWWPRLTTAQAILALVLFIALWQGFLTTDIQYNRGINSGNQQTLIQLVNETHDLINKQGNLSASQRSSLIHQFSEIAQHGGFATKEDTAQNLNLTHLNTARIHAIYDNLTRINLKLDKLLNVTK